MSTALMPRLNQHRELDPDFGNGITAQAIFHLVHVAPVEKGMRPYDLLVYLPAYPYMDAGISVVKWVLDIFLESGDRYEICMNPLKHGQFDSRTTPKIAFSPHKPDEFFWLVPPRHQWN